eukprot:jgi/Psemu1/288090/fgenesh1_pg.235_\
MSMEDRLSKGRIPGWCTRNLSYYCIDFIDRLRECAAKVVGVLGEDNSQRWVEFGDTPMFNLDLITSVLCFWWPVITSQRPEFQKLRLLELRRTNLAEKLAVS